MQSADRKITDKSKCLSQEEVLLTSHEEISNCDIRNGKFEELQKRKDHNVYKLVNNESQNFITLDG